MSDEFLEAFRRYWSALQAALADSVDGRGRDRLARESAKLDPQIEQRLADEGLANDVGQWPEF
jgi:hypothetical protein